ncbi:MULTISPECIES: PhzF family phenazine biosynthesis protein [unclassified Arcicella]|uniref:PhzF family phenazine biosynthesis protein n=1 Tax=unclassified Arcicella TaxID=2644986 RepID=UPI0028569A2C|nr:MULTISPECIES: PhzF family phenazine biosynthesis protein [unclassified Arcicella]MDR6562684.1 PhzF family phenazine biosynthesis protein [Arcicella sp. BE51]MDR6812971.1 PhzF family phenazine biosynthesis protein [Arcicella sp. BE140]MDR6824285.1 PhzF family phenazine biosynthesis protein [Arcicella sp. BE139]
MNLTIYQLDAFTNEVFAGNPAAVVPLTEWITDELMQKIAAENNLAETAFYVAEGEQFHIRWFTPTVEVNLCGHATLATAYTIFEYAKYLKTTIEFKSKSGVLKVAKKDDLLELDFPVDIPVVAETPEELIEGLGIKPQETLKGITDYFLVFENESQVKALKPDFKTIAKVKCRGIIVTAKGDKVDFVSRFFGPQSGIDEDPVTGSAHTTLTPYWAEKLGKNILTAKQISARGGELLCTLVGDRVKMAGKVAPYLIGEIIV